MAATQINEQFIYGLRAERLASFPAGKQPGGIVFYETDTKLSYIAIGDTWEPFAGGSGDRVLFDEFVLDTGTITSIPVVLRWVGLELEVYEAIRDGAVTGISATLKDPVPAGHTIVIAIQIQGIDSVALTLEAGAQHGSVAISASLAPYLATQTIGATAFSTGGNIGPATLAVAIELTNTFAS